MTDAGSEFKSDLKAFFETYIAAFARQDASALCDLWDEVGLFPSPSGNFSMDREAFRGHCVTLMEFYRKQGVAKPTGQLLLAEELFPGVAQVRMAYRMLGADSELIAEWEHVYVLRKTNNLWRVSLTIADDEMAAWVAIGAEF